MKKYIKQFILLIILIVVITSGCVDKKGITKEQLRTKFSEIETIYNDEKTSGYNLSTVDNLLKDAQIAYEKNDYQHSYDLLIQASKELERVKQNETSDEIIKSSITPLQSSKIPPEFQKQINEINSWLDEKIIDWAPRQFNKMEFIGIIPPMIAEKSTEDISYKYIELLDSAGVDTIAVYLLPTWTSQEQKYYNIFNRIKNNGKKLYVVFQAYAPIEKISWDEYVNDELTTIDRIIPAYKPDYFAIVIEPEMNKRNAQFGEISVSDWKSLIVESANKIKKYNPSTKTIIATSKDQNEIDIIDSAMTVSGIDIIGLNNYGIQMDIFNDVINSAHANNRDVWITETWVNWKNVDKAWLEETNNKWIKAMVYYSQQKNISAIAPFFTRYFFTYAPNTDLNNELSTSLANGTRTSTFNEYMSMIKEVKSKSS